MPCSEYVLNETQACVLPANVDCILSSWTAWSDCTTSCNGGWQIRSREIQRASQGSGLQCGSLTMTQQCSPSLCPEPPCVAAPCPLGFDFATGTIGNSYVCQEDDTNPIGRICIGLFDVLTSNLVFLNLMCFNLVRYRCMRAISLWCTWNVLSGLSLSSHQRYQRQTMHHLRWHYTIPERLRC
jgi:hypothetical protein